MDNMKSTTHPRDDNHVGKFQLFVVRSLIEEAIVDIDTIKSMLANGRVKDSLAVLQCTHRALSDYMIEFNKKYKINTSAIRLASKD